MKTITLVANNRLHYLQRLVENVKANNLTGYTLFVGVEPNDLAVVDYCRNLSFMPTEVTVNTSCLGVSANPLATIRRAFDAGSEFNVALEDDLLLSPDALDLANWFFALGQRRNYLLLNLCNYGSDASFPNDVEESRHFIPIGWAVDRANWETHIRRNWNLDPRGWDFSVNRLVEEGSGLKLLQPKLARCNHNGREGGVHCTPEFHDRVFVNLAMNQQCVTHFRLSAGASANNTQGTSGMNIKLVTYFNRGMAEVGDITSRVLRNYAEQHGYTAICQTSSFEPYRDPAWNKVALVRQALACEWCDWVMWFDADAIVANMDVKIEDIIAQLPPSKDAAFGTDDNGLCTGVFLIKNTMWSRSFMDAVWFLQDINFENEYGDGRRWEQNCIKGLAKHFLSVASKIHLLPQRIINSYQSQFQPGDFILHLASQTNEQRLRCLRQLQKQKTLPRLEIESQHDRPITDNIPAAVC